MKKICGCNYLFILMFVIKPSFCCLLPLYDERSIQRRWGSAEMMVNYQGVRRRRAVLVQMAVRTTDNTPVFAYISLCFTVRFFDFFFFCWFWLLLILGFYYILYNFIYNIWYYIIYIYYLYIHISFYIHIKTVEWTPYLGFVMFFILSVQLGMN